MATALYRRYRPEAFSEMIGQAHVTEPLMTALRTGRIGHAYLFSGPRGCGKTTSARILARCLNCAEGPTDTPCGTCPSCVELSREGGGSLDVVEIDAASHGGVDDARELRERAVFAPARDRYKIFIIDEAHMVTSGGFNALLKIVEEPPPHVKFIFATTEPEKVIGTIRSRTHHYPFRLIAPGTLIDYVQQLCDSEAVQVEPGVLPLVVRSGGGSVRDTLSILDQLIAGSEAGSVTLERATGLLGFTSAELLDEVVVALGSGDSAQAFAATDRVVQTGQDPRRFVEDLLERLRDLIVISATNVQGASAVFRGVPDDQLQRMFEQSQAFAPGQLSRIADTVSEALDHMTGATAPRLHLELMIARALITRAPARDESPAATQVHNSTGPGAVAPPRPQGGAPAAAAPPVSAAGSAPAGPSTPAGSPAPATEGGRADAANSGAVPPAPEAPATGTPAPTNAAPSAEPAQSTQQVDVIAAMRSARDFLNSDGPKAPMVPLGGHPPASPEIEAEPEAETIGAPEGGSERPAEPESATSGGGAPSADGAQVGIDELRDVWPALLEELLEGDRDAWNAVKNVQPLSLDGEILTVGVPSRSDLEVFKAAGAGPLREVIVAAVGVSVKYVPRPMPAGTPGSSDSDRSSVDGAGAEPHDAEPSLTPDPVATTPDQTAATPEPTAATAERTPIDDATMPGSPDLPPDEPSEPQDGFDDSALVDSGLGEPGVDAGPGVDGEADASAAAQSAASVPAAPDAPTESEDPTPQSATETAPDPRPSASAGTPRFQSTRYGEAVVRELLGARFIEERPVPQNEE